MKKENNSAVEKVRSLMNEVIEFHNKELRDCEENVEASRREIEAAEEDLKRATASTDFDAYAKAKQKKDRAETALEMYTAKLKQTQEAGLISDDKSDEAVESVFKYEDDITAAYLKDAASHVAALQSLEAEYNKALEESRGVLTKWVGSVHPYYKNGVQVFRNGKPMMYGATVIRQHEESNALSQTINEFSYNAALMKYVKEL